MYLMTICQVLSAALNKWRCLCEQCIPKHVAFFDSNNLLQGVAESLTLANTCRMGARCAATLNYLEPVEVMRGTYIVKSFQLNCAAAI